ncbi:28 kDa ribonucleoprotein [Spatholobus suberectus]|nr:28 kDa ribonucleoprotein [Spatholobus suberectus]
MVIDRGKSRSRSTEQTSSAISTSSCLGSATREGRSEQSATILLLRSRPSSPTKAKSSFFSDEGEVVLLLRLSLLHTFVTPPSSYSSVLTLKLYKPQSKRFVLHFALPRRSRTSLESSSSFSPPRKEREDVAERLYGEEYVYPQNDDVFGDEEEREGKLGRACEVYVCNLPRSCDAAYLLDMFRPYGTILSVEVCRNAETDESKGCGYVTMGSIYSARNAVAALDGSVSSVKLSPLLVLISLCPRCLI